MDEFRNTIYLWIIRGQIPSAKPKKLIVTWLAASNVKPTSPNPELLVLLCTVAGDRKLLLIDLVVIHSLMPVLVHEWCCLLAPIYLKIRTHLALVIKSPVAPPPKMQGWPALIPFPFLLAGFIKKRPFSSYSLKKKQYLNLKCQLMIACCSSRAFSLYRLGSNKQCPSPGAETVQSCECKCDTTHVTYAKSHMLPKMSTTSACN